MTAHCEGTGQPASAEAGRRHGVRAVERAFDILTAFSDAHPKLALHELADATCLPKASAHRIAATLIDYGFLRQTPEGDYTLGMRIVELARFAANSSPLLKIAGPIAAEMSALTHETVLTAEIDWKDRTVLVVDRVDAEHALAVFSPVGRHSHISCGCMAKAALAGWPAETAAHLIRRLPLIPRTPHSITDPAKLTEDVEQSRAQGFATERDEFYVGVVGVAVPIMLAEHPIGVVAVVAPGSRCPPRRLNEIGTQLREVVDKLYPPEARATGTAPAARRLSA
jgi:DNA-binding IclR family transcriptional regulator